MKSKLLVLVAAAGLTASLLAGCAAPSPAPARDVPAVSVKPTATATPCGSCDGKPQADHTGPSEPVWDARSKQDAVSVGTAAMALYNRRTVDGTQWINDLAHYMTPQAGALYQGVDPANLPVFNVKGAGHLVIDPANGFAAQVRFTTTGGVFDFELLRQGTGQAWKLNQIIMPAGLH